MRVFIDLDSQQLVTGPGTNSPLNQLRFKRGDSSRIEVMFLRRAEGQELGVGASGKFGIKAKGDYDGGFVVYAASWTKEGTGASALYVFEPNFNTEELNVLLGSNGESGDDEASLELMGEFEWVVNEAIYSTQTLAITVDNDVIKGMEGTPEQLPNPGDYYTESEVDALLAGKVDVINVKLPPYSATGDGETDDTEAIQAAVDAAASTGINRVYFPIGRYRCNIVVPENVHLFGAGAGTRHQFYEEGPPWDFRVYPTVLLPNTTEEACVRFNSIYGSSVSDLSIINVGAQAGIGLQLSNLASYCGSSFSVDRVYIANFQTGFLNEGGVDITCRDSVFTDSVINVHSKDAENEAPGDNVLLLNCVTGGPTSDYCFKLKTTRVFTVMGGDHNLAKYIADVENSSIFLRGNFETATGPDNSALISGESAVIEIHTGSNFQSISNPRVLVELRDGSLRKLRIGDITVQAPGLVKDGLMKLVRTAGSEPFYHLPKGGRIERYTDNTWSTLSAIEYSDDLYVAAGTARGLQTIVDTFTSRFTSPFCALGWTITTLAGSGGVARHYGPLGRMGVCEVVTGSASSGDRALFALPNGLLAQSAWGWDMQWDIMPLDNPDNIYLKIGLMDLSDTVTPNGVYFRVDRSVPDATWKIEVRTSDVSTVTDTGVAYNAPVTRLRMRNTSDGLLVNCGVAHEQLIAAPGIAAIYTRPAVILGNTSAAYLNVLLDRFQFDRDF